MIFNKVQQEEYGKIERMYPAEAEFPLMLRFRQVRLDLLFKVRQDVGEVTKKTGHLLTDVPLLCFNSLKAALPF